MNRKQRRALERKGIIQKKEPVYSLKPSEIKQAVLTGPAHETMVHEINQNILRLDKQFTLDMDTMVLATLHKHYGFGAKRLKEFYMLMFQEHLRMREYYEMDELYPERAMLKEAGADVEAWFDALFDDKGNYKKPEDIKL